MNAAQHEIANWKYYEIIFYLISWFSIMTSVGYNFRLQCQKARHPSKCLYLSKIQIFSLKLRINLLGFFFCFFFFKANNLKILASSQRRKMETEKEKAMLLELSQQTGQPHGKKSTQIVEGGL